MPSAREVLLQATIRRLTSELSAASSERDRAVESAAQLRRALEGLTARHQELQARGLSPVPLICFDLRGDFTRTCEPRL